MNVLMLGLSGTGKTTFLAQLFGRMRAGEGSLHLREAPSDISSIREAYERLAQGLAVEHTTTDASALPLVLPAESTSGTQIDISMPDYAGESLQRLVITRRVDDGWRELLTGSDAWLLFVRLEHFPELPELLDKPVGELIEEHQKKAAKDEPAASRWVSGGELPLDMQLVELAQVLLHERQAQPRSAGNMPALTVLLSCWDELDNPDGHDPEEHTRRRIPLLYHFLTTMWPPSMLTFLGVSAQGRALSPDQPDESYAEQAPASHGYLIDPDGRQTVDLSVAIPQP